MDISIYDCTPRKLEILFLKPILNIERIWRGSNIKQMYKIQKLLSGGPGVKNPPSNAGDVGLIPSQGTKTSHKPHGTVIHQ